MIIFKNGKENSKYYFFRKLNVPSGVLTGFFDTDMEGRNFFKRFPRAKKSNYEFVKIVEEKW